MSVTIKRVYLGQIASTNTTVYTCPPNTKARAINCTITNTDSSARTVSAHKVETGGTVADDRLLLSAKAIAVNATYEPPEVIGQVLEAGDFISMVGSVASKLTVSLDVVEIV